MIETQQDWNERLGYCGCCEMPECPAVSLVVEKKESEVIETQDQSWHLEQIQWRYERDAWVAEDPENRVPGDYPVAYPTEPAITYPAGTTYRTLGSANIGSFEEPVGDDTDDLPTIWREAYTGGSGGTLDTGTVQKLEYSTLSGGRTVFNLLTVSYADPSPVTATLSTGTHDPVPDPEECDIEFDDDASFGFLPIPTWIDRGTPNECTETTKKSWSIHRDWDEGSIITLPSCPGPFSGADEVYADRTQESFAYAALADSITKSQLITNSVDDLSYRSWEGGSSSDHATLQVDWPTIGDAKDGGAWPSCSDAGVYAFVVSGGSASAQSIRFRFQIPTSHPGSYYKITYDIVEIPEEGDPSFLSEDNTVVWTGPGTPIPDPILNEAGDITNQAAIDSAEDTWLTDWVELAQPDVPGERRVVNIRFTCYHGTKYGVKPQTTGEAFTIEA